MAGITWKALTVSLLAALLAGCTHYAPLEVEEETYSRAALISDFDAGLSFIKETHPDLSYSADAAVLETTAVMVRDRLKDGMSAREAWAEMALMNPVFGDAHVGFRRPLAALAAYEQQGGTLFPLATVTGRDGKLYAAAEGPGVAHGDEILSINGIPAEDMIAYWTPRMRGETPELGQLVLQLYFPIFYWAQNGGYDDYIVRLRRADGHVATVTLASADAYAPTDEKFTYKHLGSGIGYLEARTFDIGQLEAFRAFLAEAFAKIADDDIRTLIIDIRANGGGANDLADLLTFYLTDEPYSFISSVKARITPENIALVPIEGVQPGMVLDLPLKQPRTPTPELANRFDGEVYVLTGKMTYSAAIVFTTTVQDYGLGKIAGEAPLGAANQTGQVQAFDMPATGLEALAPLYIFRRPNGDTSRAQIEVDIPITDDPLAPVASADALVDKLEKEGPNR